MVFLTGAGLISFLVVAAYAGEPSTSQPKSPSASTGRATDADPDGTASTTAPNGKICTQVEIPPPADGKGSFEMMTVCH